MTTLTRWFADSVERHPERIALEVEGAAYSYRNLDALSRTVAAAVLRRCGGHPPPSLGVAASRTVTAYAGYLAAIRLGSAVVPLNPGAPLDRNRAAAAAAGLTIVVTGEPPTPGIPEELAERIPDRPGPDTPAWTPAARPDDVAYILFTSGSTGSPKGVPIRHRQVHAYLDFVIPRYGFGPESRVVQTAELTFDISVLSLWGAWGTGGTLVVPGDQDRLSPARYVERERLTHWVSVPSAISLAGRRRPLAADAMPSLRWSLFCGEPLTVAQADAWMAAASSSTLVNLYGPTEVTVSCLDHIVPAQRRRWPATDTVPIGEPHPGTEIAVVGADGRPAATGELCVRGRQRFDGYLDSGQNVGRFAVVRDGRMVSVADPAERLSVEHWYRTGDLVTRTGSGHVHLGRLDDQIKIRGYRVELGEIEAVLRRDTRVHEVVAVLVRDAAGDDGIEAAVVGDAVDVAALTVVLRGQLPGYMVPRRILAVDQLPRNGNGKIDRGAVRDLLSLAGAAGPG